MPFRTAAPISNVQRLRLSPAFPPIGFARAGRFVCIRSGLFAVDLYHFLHEDGRFEIKDVIALKDQNGEPLTGLPNKLTIAKTEKPVDANGVPLEQSVSSIDSEGIIRLSDGSYWIGEENGPSILHVLLRTAS